MNIKNLFKHKIFQQKKCPIPKEYLDKIGHIILCPSGNCCRCYHWKDYQLEAYKKETEEYIREQHKTITDLNKKLKELTECLNNKLIKCKECGLYYQFNGEYNNICNDCKKKFNDDYLEINIRLLKETLKLLNELSNKYNFRLSSTTSFVIHRHIELESKNTLQRKIIELMTNNIIYTCDKNDDRLCDAKFEIGCKMCVKERFENKAKQALEGTKHD